MIPWTVAPQAPRSMEFFRQEYWSGLPLLPQDDLPDPEIKLGSPAVQADSLLSEPPGGDGKKQSKNIKPSTSPSELVYFKSLLLKQICK